MANALAEKLKDLLRYTRAAIAEIERLQAVVDAMPIDAEGEAVKVKVVCVLGEISLHIGDSQMDLSQSQARELAELLAGAAEFAD